MRVEPMNDIPSVRRRHFLQMLLWSGTALAAGDAGQGKRWRVGVIGSTGRGDYGHGLDTMWLKLPETEIAGVADAGAAGLAGAVERLEVGRARGYADYRRMLAEVAPEIVAICPRHMTEHHAMAMAAIRGGAKGIYIEKPFCPTPAQAEEVAVAAREAGVKVAIAHRNRYHPALAKVKELVDGGRLGRLLEIRCRGKEDARGGMQDLWVLGSHVLDLAIHFAGGPLSCESSVLKDGRPVSAADMVEGKEGIGHIAGNEVHARWIMESGVPVFFDSIAGAGGKDAGFGLHLIGTEGVIDLRMDTKPLAHFLEGNPFRPVTEPRAWIPVSSAGIGVAEPDPGAVAAAMDHTLAARDLIASITGNREPLCSATDGVAVVRMTRMVKLPGM